MIENPKKVTVLLLVIMISAFTAHLVNAQNVSQSPPKTVVLQGKVVDTATGSVVPYITIQLNSAGRSNRIDETKTDNSGRFTIKALNPGKYTLNVRTNNYRLYSQTVTVDQPRNDVVIKLQPMHQATSP